MSYGLLYQSTFDPVTEPVANPVYKLEILKKNYSGSYFNVKAAGRPVVHSWNTDEPKAAVKGSSLQISLLNEGSLPLTSFYGEDDTFKVRLYWKTQLMFEGFIVQDDCNEVMIDFTHEITLSATDNLGLLKKVPLNEAPANYDIVFTYSGLIATLYAHSAIVDNTFGSQLTVGSKIRIQGTTVDGIYTVSSLFYDPGNNNWGLDFVEIIQNSNGAEAATLSILTNFLLQKVKLISIIKSCLLATGLELNTNIYSNIHETSQGSYGTTYRQTLIDPQTFLKDDVNYEDCYSILSKILDRFNLTLFQSKGVWNLVRWDELRYYSNLTTGYAFDKDFNLLINSIALPAPFVAGIGEVTFAETGLYRKILRPYNFDKEQFNYKQPAQLLRNANLQQLGTLQRTYTTGSGVNLQTINEYNVPFWFDSSLAPAVADYFIRVILDNLNNEIERYLVVKNDNIISYKIEVNAGDTFTYSFSFKTADSQPGPYNLSFLVELKDGTNTRFVREPGRVASAYTEPGWANGPGWQIPIASTDNTNQWRTVTIESKPIPFDGLLYCFLIKADISGGDGGTFYKDIRFDYTPLINQSTKIIGHTHKNLQVASIKNNQDEEIFIDSSPRNSIAGTLFLDEMNGLLQKRTVKWQRGSVAESRNLGDLTTFEELFYRRVPRAILEGTMIGLTTYNTNIYGAAISIVNNGDGTQTVTFTWTSSPANTIAVTISYNNGVWHDNTGAATSPRTYTMPVGAYLYRIRFELSGGGSVTYNFNSVDDHVSMLSVFKYTYLNNLNFVFGKLDIDYRHNTFTSTLWEIYNDGEVDADLNNFYGFNYLYAAK